MKLAGHYREYPFSYFLVSMLAVIVLSPLAEGRHGGVIFIQMLFTAMMAAAVYAASARRGHQLIALGLAIPWLFLSWLGELGIMAVPVLLSRGPVIAMSVFVGFVILRRLTTAQKIGVDIMAGAIGLYLLIAMSWAMSFVVIETLAPGSFAGGGTPITWSEALYFSLTTITTLGYGDITPASAFAGIWSTMGAVTGVLYVAVLIARLATLFKA